MYLIKVLSFFVFRFFVFRFSKHFPSVFFQSFYIELGHDNIQRRHFLPRCNYFSTAVYTVSNRTAVELFPANSLLFPMIPLPPLNPQIFLLRFRSSHFPKTMWNLHYLSSLLEYTMSKRLLYTLRFCRKLSAAKHNPVLRHPAWQSRRLEVYVMREKSSGLKDPSRSLVAYLTIRGLPTLP